MSVHMSTEGTGAVSHDDVNCVLGVLSAPDYVVNQIETTRALDGQQVEGGGVCGALDLPPATRAADHDHRQWG